MVRFEYEDLRFKEKDNKVSVTFMNIYRFDLDLSNLGNYKVEDNAIEFEEDVSNKYNMILSKALDNDLKGLYNNKVVYVHKGRLPLIGYHSFGIVDRGTSIIEVRPVTGCNLDCIYCSVDEGKSSKKVVDFVVEPDYLVEETEKLLNFKKIPVEIHIGVQGEPLLYSRINYLIEKLSKLEYCKLVSMETNCTLLTNEVIDELVKAGLKRISLSIDALDEKLAKKLQSSNFSVNHAITMAKYCVSKGLDTLIAPVWVPGMNDEEIPKLVEFANKIGAGMGIQNFLEYKSGRNPAKQKPWDKFYEELKEMEERYDTKLILSGEDFEIVNTPAYPRPFRKGDVIKPEFICPGRHKNEFIAVFKDRCISVIKCFKKGKIKVIRDKDNIFAGVSI